MTRKNHKFEVFLNDPSLVLIDFSQTAALNIRSSILIEINENMIRRKTKNVTSSNDHKPMVKSTAFNKKIDINPEAGANKNIAFASKLGWKFFATAIPEKKQMLNSTKKSSTNTGLSFTILFCLNIYVV